MRLTKLGFLMTLIASPLCMEAENLDVKRIEIDKERSVDFLSCDAIGKQGLILTTKDDDNQKNTQKNEAKASFFVSYIFYHPKMLKPLSLALSNRLLTPSVKSLNPSFTLSSRS